MKFKDSSVKVFRFRFIDSCQDYKDYKYLSLDILKAVDNLIIVKGGRDWDAEQGTRVGLHS